MYKDTLIQIDMGLSLKTVKSSLKKLNKNIEDIDTLLITHNHNDHIKCLCLYHEQIPIYCSKDSLKDGPITIVKPGDSITIKDIKVKIVKTSHDAPNPIGFVFYCGDESLCYLTDSGIIPVQTLKIIKNCTYFVFESNHDVDMLENSGRPVFLISRILSKKGHLSNVQSANYLSSLIGPKTKKVMIAHLSEECNNEELALETHRQSYGRDGLEIVALKQNKETVL